jgi:nitrogen fixation protein FixH
MSYIGGVPAQLPSRGSRWRLYPWAMASAMGLVFAVNAGMVWWALATFPGAATSDSFDTSNEYNRVLAAVDRQNALGWTISAESDAHRPVLRLASPDGHPLSGAAIEATATRPLGPPESIHLIFHAADGGRYVADTELARPGQWDLMLHIAKAGNEMRVTRRVTAK